MPQPFLRKRQFQTQFLILIRKHLICRLSFWFILFSVPLRAQNQYFIDAVLDPENATITVSQTIHFTNPSNEQVSILFLYDWSNAYQGAPSPLANHLAKQFNRSFYLRSKNKLGFTLIKEIETVSNSLKWSRLENQLDIIKIELGQPLVFGDSLSIKIKYEIKIPDDTFTGVGIMADESFLLRDTFITLAPKYNQQWLLNSNLGFRDHSPQPSTYNIHWSFPSNYNAYSNLDVKRTDNSLDTSIKTLSLEAIDMISPEFVFQKKETFKTIKLGNQFSIVTDILPNKNSNFDFEQSLIKIDSFVKQYLTPISGKKLLVLKKDYNRNPIVGISEAFSFLKPFTEEFIFETKFIKAYLASYLNELLIMDKRKNHWITGGIQTYIMMKYVETYYPDSKFLGELKSFSLLGVRPFKNYSAANIGYNESFSFIYEFSEHANRQQADTLGKELMTKSNELYASPYHVGSGLFYLDTYLSDDILKNSLFTFSEERGQKKMQDIIAQKTDKNLDWFFKTYLPDREAHDLYIKRITKKTGQIEVTIAEKNNKSVPFKLDVIKDDQIISEQWMEHQGKDSIVQLPNIDADFIAINSNLYLPEKNRLNNWKYLQSATGFKPFKLTFYGDSENLKRNQLFYHPISDFNAYDGFTAGMRFYNTRVKNQPFEIDLHPQYSVKENEWVGFFRTRYRFINHKSKNYLNEVFLTGKSYHYNTNLRYTAIQPSFSMYFRPLDLQSNKRQLINASWYKVFRDHNPNINVNPDYSVLSFLHRYENSDAVNTFSTNSNVEIADKFGKTYFSSQYRKLYPSGRQLSLRFFAGKFLWHNTTETHFFDFNLNRSPDYLFRYDYLGRSEDTGIYSQQFIPAEGGFKAFFDQSSANDYMFSINGAIGLWKWIEFYGDLGALKNRDRKAVGYFDSGIKINLVPDFFEVFFPLYSSNGLEPIQSRYATKIRFIFVPRLNTLSSLFTRKWF